MPVHDSGEASASPIDPPSVPPVRPSWATPGSAPRPAAPPRPAFTPRPTTSAAAEAPRPYYAASPPPAATPPRPAPPAQAEEPVQYDLAGNPIASTPRLPVHAPPAPFGYSAGVVASWPPPVGGFAPGGVRNNSGEQDQVPPEIDRLRWHWGAFFFPILWTKKHGLTTIAATLAGGLFALRMIRYGLQFVSPVAFLVLCGVYAVAYFGVQIYFGLNGHRIGWRNRHFPGGLDEYFKVQNAWMWWGFGINVTLGIILPVLAVMGLGMLGLSAAHTSRYGNGYGSNYGSGYSRPYHPWSSSASTAPDDSGSAAPVQGGN